MHDEQIAAVLDSASTWEGVRRVESAPTEQTLTLEGNEFGRVDGATVAAAFPERLARAVVRHGHADGRETATWATLSVTEGDDVDRAVELLWLSYLNHVAQIRQWRPDAVESVDVRAGLDEVRPSPGVRHLVRHP